MPEGSEGRKSLPCPQEAPSAEELNHTEISHANAESRKGPGEDTVLKSHCLRGRGEGLIFKRRVFPVGKLGVVK